MSSQNSIEADYRRASKMQKEDFSLVQTDALLGMGYLLGAGMAGAASAMTALYVQVYGWDELPDALKELEKGDD